MQPLFIPSAYTVPFLAAHEQAITGDGWLRPRQGLRQETKNLRSAATSGRSLAVRLLLSRLEARVGAGRRPIIHAGALGAMVKAGVALRANH